MRQIGTLGTIDTLTVGGRVFSNLSSLIQLYGCVLSATNRYTSFRKPNTTSGYAPSGVTFRVCAITAQSYITNTQNAASIYYADNDSGIASTTAPVNPVYVGGSAGNSGLISELLAATTTVGDETIYILDFVIPSGKFLGVDNNAQANQVVYKVYGYEV